MADKYGSYYNNGSYDVFRAAIRYEVTTSETSVTIRCRSWIQTGDAHDSGSNFQGQAYITDSYSSWVTASGYLNAGDESGWLGDISKTFTRTHSDQTVTCSGRGWSSTWDAYTPWVNADVTIPKRKSYTVSYNANGGSGAPSSQTKWHGESLTLSSTKPTRTGYTFKGWATSPTGSVAYSSGASYTGNAVLALYAVWQAVTYTVTYSANGHGTAPSAQTKTYGVALTLRGSMGTVNGYKFRYWNTKADGTGTSKAAGASYTDNAALKLYAIWYAPNTITYNANGGTGAPSSQTKVHGDSITLSSTKPTRTGYRFLGWATTQARANAGSVDYAAGASYSSNANLSLYAAWQAQAPSLTVDKVYRAKSTGAADDEETYVRVIARWTQVTSAAVTVTASIVVDGVTYSASTAASTESAGNVDLLLDTSGNLAQDASYTVTVRASSSLGTTTKTYRLGTAAWPIDVLKGGLGVAIGKAATFAKTLEVGWTLRLAGALRQHASALGDTKIGVDVPSSAVYGANHAAYDAAGRNIFYSQFGRTAGDFLYRSFVVQRKDANDATVQNGFYVGINANGEPYINFTSGGREAWLEGLGIGTVVENDISTAVSVASGSWKTIGSFALPAGIWVLDYNAVFSSNATGRRGVTISVTQDNAGTTAEQRHLMATQQATNGMGTVMGNAAVYKANGNTTTNLNVLQNSGSALNVTGFMRAVRIG